MFTCLFIVFSCFLVSDAHYHFDLAPDIPPCSFRSSSVLLLRRVVVVIVFSLSVRTDTSREEHDTNLK